VRLGGAGGLGAAERLGGGTGAREICGAAGAWGMEGAGFFATGGGGSDLFRTDGGGGVGDILGGELGACDPCGAGGRGREGGGGADWGPT
jgi:hypothetical protein